MNPRRELALWSTAVILAAAGLVVIRRPLILENKTQGMQASPAAAVDEITTTRSPVEAVVSADPFRLDRLPASVAFSLTPPVATPTAAARPAVATPALVLRGIAGGPPWQALVEGIPGRNGATVVRTGDRIGDLRVMAINRDAVVVRGADTTWTLTMVRAWR